MIYFLLRALTPRPLHFVRPALVVAPSMFQRQGDACIGLQTGNISDL